jgi:hypothetical protein
MTRAAWRAGVLGALNLAVRVLAVRLTLMLSVLGAVALTLYAIELPDPWRLGAVAIYTLTCVVPLIWLAAK